MLKCGGKKTTLSDALLTDDEFEQIPKTHFARKNDTAAQTSRPPQPERRRGRR
jgi:hypothetical protein